jgi:hypothetical protein
VDGVSRVRHSSHDVDGQSVCAQIIGNRENLRRNLPHKANDVARAG